MFDEYFEPGSGNDDEAMYHDLGYRVVLDYRENTFCQSSFSPGLAKQSISFNTSFNFVRASDDMNIATAVTLGKLAKPLT